MDEEKSREAFETFVTWWRSEGHRLKYDTAHPVFLGAYEAWQAGRRDLIASMEPYGYHLVAEATGNGIAFAPADDKGAITDFMKAYPGTTFVALTIIPKEG